jgi:hypothetical protein
MQITLSTRPLGLEEGTKGRNVTCQYVMIRRKKATTKPTLNPGASEVVEETTTDQTSKMKTDETRRQEIKAAATDKDLGEKRKLGSSQASAVDPIRGGKKRKK